VSVNVDPCLAGITGQKASPRMTSCTKQAASADLTRRQQRRYYSAQPVTAADTMAPRPLHGLLGPGGRSTNRNSATTTLNYRKSATTHHESSPIDKADSRMSGNAYPENTNTPCSMCISAPSHKHAATESHYTAPLTTRKLQPRPNQTEVSRN